MLSWFNTDNNITYNLLYFKESRYRNMKIFNLAEELEKERKKTKDLQQELKVVEKVADSRMKTILEIEKFVENELKNNIDGVKSFGGYQCKVILDKINELKGDNK